MIIQETNNKILKIITILISVFVLVSCKTTRNIENVLNEFTTNDFEIIEKSKGDLNLDGILDVAIVTSNKGNSERELIVYLLDKNSKIISEHSNKNIIHPNFFLTYSFYEIVLKNGTLSVSYYGGRCHRENHELVFKYNSKLKELYFEILKVTEHNVCNDSEPYEYTETNSELRKIKFIDYIKDY